MGVPPAKAAHPWFVIRSARAGVVVLPGFVELVFEGDDSAGRLGGSALVDIVRE